MGKGLATWLLLATAVAAPTAAPRDVVQTAVTAVLTALEDTRSTQPEPGVARRANVNVERSRAEIRKIAAEFFDFDEVARRTLSRHWGSRSKQEQKEFISLFTDLLERSYVGKIEAYSGEKIVYTGEMLDGQYALVRSRIITKRSRSDVALDYRLHLTGSRWKVYDVLIDGVSFVSTYRSEFNRVIQSTSWDELIDRLRKRQIEIRTVNGRSES